MISMQVAQQPELKNDPDTVFVGNFSCLLRQHVFRCFFFPFLVPLLIREMSHVSDIGTWKR
jgi:hypothetical protein